MTGFKSIHVKDSRLPSFDKDLKPMIRLVDGKGEEIKIKGSSLTAHFTLPRQ